MDGEFIRDVEPGEIVTITEKGITSDIEMAREQVKQQLEEGLLEEQFIEIEVADVPKGNQLDMFQIEMN